MDQTIDSISVERLKRQVQEALALVAQAAEALPFLVSLTTDQHQHTLGKLKLEEPNALHAVIETVRKHPQPFGALALDAEALHGLLVKREMLAAAADQVRQFADDLADTVLHLGESVKVPALAAYHVGAAIAPHDDRIAHDLQPAISFYRSVGRAAARTRRAHQDAASKPAPQA
jgi:hypothetical protein